MQLVDENTAITVGKYYHVRCAKMIHDDKGKTFLVPIIGELHNDKQFGFVNKHYHIDGRFYVPAAFSVDSNGRTNTVIVTEKPYNACRFVGIEIVKKKCIRLTTGINPPSRGFKLGLYFEPGKKYWDWYDSMIGKSCKGKKCPHLGHTMQEIDGVLVCPLHNLVGCIKTETIIKEVAN